MADRFSFATGTNAHYIEQMYEEFKRQPDSIDFSWQQFFEGYEFALHGSRVASRSDASWDSSKVEAWINALRTLGHLSAHLNPLDDAAPPNDNLKPATHGLAHVKPADVFHPTNFGSGDMTFEQISDKLTATYCGSIGADFREINNIEIVTWLQTQMEGCNNRPEISAAEKKRILFKLSQAEGFEQFLQARYLGQKRFSLEGLDALIPLMDTLIDQAGENGVEEICIGMAHRGRLNVLANVMEKPYPKMLIEFEGSEYNPFDIDGDVKYHMGFASKVKSNSGKDVRLFLSPNPSHLEAVNPLVEGIARYRQEVLGGESKNIPVLLHGDAAFIGQGLVTEVLNLSDIKDYRTGGTIHIITNNQIGFTTNPEDGKSCAYSSDICKVIRAPVLHVNADDPEAVIWVAKLAVMYRMRFFKDIVIDLVGYRRHGHNETDEPGFTQPVMYRKIGSHPTVLTSYKAKLVQAGIVTAEEADQPYAEMRAKMQTCYEELQAKKVVAPVKVPAEFEAIFAYKRATREELMRSFPTQVKAGVLQEVGAKILEIPKGFTPHPKIKKLFQSRAKMLKEGSIDWGFGELLAFATLAHEGFSIRLSGQDCKRGTFSSRHAVLFDFETNASCEPLNQVGPGSVKVINSPLSEQGCLGFELGYSIAAPKNLVLWEAQFGDFANGAQIIIDQFLVASEAKWQLTSSLVLLLPHGYEGMGPEHSSARPERFLQCCGNLNIQVCNLTTPAQIFHALRRQMHREAKKPLIIMSPKSLLRHPKVVSPLADFTEATFHEVIDDVTIKDRKKIEKVLMCSGKLFYELDAQRETHPELANQPIIRCEQLYPFPYEVLTKVFATYPHLKEVVWVQEEPRNMGGWSFFAPRVQDALGLQLKVSYVGRKHSGTTAEGSKKAHQIEQQRIIDDAFALVSGISAKPAKKAASR